MKTPAPGRGLCVVVCAGRVLPAFLPEKRPGDFWIAADAGYRTAVEAGRTPDLFVGDGDSLGTVPEVPEKKVLPRVKDDTDSAAAVKAGLERGFRRFCLLGALGGDRFSHAAANVQLLRYLRTNGAEGLLADERCVLRFLSPEDGTFELPAGPGGFFSLFALDGSASLSVRNAAYSGEDIRLTPDFPLGVSNEPLPGCEIRVRSGLVMLAAEPDPGVPVRRFDPVPWFRGRES
ncbi:MAG: thiamine diphosphokinase [Clostridia bacterium]|nr:thiamine diphosphokinase [Clostridia bacterium]